MTSLTTLTILLAMGAASTSAAAQPVRGPSGRPPVVLAPRQASPASGAGLSTTGRPLALDRDSLQNIPPPPLVRRRTAGERAVVARQLLQLNSTPQVIDAVTLRMGANPANVYFGVHGSLRFVSEPWAIMNDEGFVDITVTHLQAGNYLIDCDATGSGDLRYTVYGITDSEGTVGLNEQGVMFVGTVTQNGVLNFKLRQVPNPNYDRFWQMRSCSVSRIN